MSERKHILVVEDDIDIANMLMLLLDMEGYAASAVGSGTAAIEHFITCVSCGAQVVQGAEAASVGICPDLILLDLQLPDMRGEEMIDRLSRTASAVPPVIVVTAKRQQAAELAVNEIGAAGMLLKPFEIQTLLDQIKLLLT